MKQIINKQSLILGIFFAVLTCGISYSLFASCLDEEYDAQIYESKLKADTNSNSAQNTWQGQVEYFKRSTVNNSKSRHKRIKFINVEQLGKVKTEDDRKFIIDKLLSDNVYTVKRNKNKGYSIVTIGELKNTGYTPDSRVTHFLNTMPLGMEMLKFTWKYGNHIYESYGIASNELGGIIYETIGYLMIDEKL